MNTRSQQSEECWCQAEHKLTHPGVDFGLFSEMEWKALEKHLSFNGELTECKERNCRVYDLHETHKKETQRIEKVEYDYSFEDESDVSICSECHSDAGERDFEDEEFSKE